MTVNFIHPLFAANVVAVFTLHIATSFGIFAMKVIWVDNKMAGVSDQFDPRAYH
jgi:hypothetical protein